MLLINKVKPSMAAIGADSPSGSPLAGDRMSAAMER